MLYPHYRIWRRHQLREEDGILVGSDWNQEWLLPYWWENYQKYNRYPVAFVDFGMSQEKKKWCCERGEYISLQVGNVFVKEKDEVQEEIAARWERLGGGNVWSHRHVWFKKPLACLQSPFRNTVWIDLDCEILGSLKTVFEACTHPSGIAIAKHRSAQSSYPTYNSGVIAFQRNLPLIEMWAHQAFARTDAFCGDQDLLSRIVFEQKIDICELPCIYNWHIGFGDNPEAIINHWLGDIGKAALQIKIRATSTL